MIARVREEEPFTAADLAADLAMRRGWKVPAYQLPPANEDRQVMRMLVKVNQSRELVDALADDFAAAIAALRARAAGRAVRPPVHRGHGY